MKEFQAIQIIACDELQCFVQAKHASPHDRLGMHQVVKNKKTVGIVVRCYIANAKECSVLNLGTKKTYNMTQIDESGFYEVFIETDTEIFKYKYVFKTYSDETKEIYDPYSFLPTISGFDCYLFGKGEHLDIYKKFGSHEREMSGVKGVSFCVWAPNAKRISVVGDFNNWDGRYYPMRMIAASGIWELFIPEITNWTRYKYEIVGANDEIFLKSDPYCSHFDQSPNNASIVYFDQKFQWDDQEWIETRAKTNWCNEPISIYELHIDSWKRIPEDNNRPLSYRELAVELVNYIKEMHFTHVEFMPVTEYPFIGSWGYQVTGFYAPTSRYGTPDDFKFLVDYLHQNNIGVIIDWVPAHFPKDAFSLAKFDGTALYEHEDSRQGTQNEWGTLVFNYGRCEVKNFLIGSALCWIENYHIDGLRVDAVASMLYLNYSRKDGEWIPNQYGGKENIEALEFLRRMNDVVHERAQGTITIAEESTSFGGITHPTRYNGVGFDFKWNMGWMHDSIAYFSKDPIYRKNHHNQLTFGMLYQYSEKFVNVFSHDEVVHGKSSMLFKMPGWCVNEKVKHLRALYSLMFAWPGKKTLFMGNEFGQSSEWNFTQSLDWHLLQYKDHSGLQKMVSDLNKFYIENKFLSELDNSYQGFEWICCDDYDNSVLSFIRKGNEDEQIVVVCNFTPVGRENYIIGVPCRGEWIEIFNSDAEIYGGLNQGNMGKVHSIDQHFHSKPFSLSLYLPPLSVLYFKQM